MIIFMLIIDELYFYDNNKHEMRSQFELHLDIIMASIHYGKSSNAGLDILTRNSKINLNYRWKYINLYALESVIHLHGQSEEPSPHNK